MLLLTVQLCASAKWKCSSPCCPPLSWRCSSMPDRHADPKPFPFVGPAPQHSPATELGVLFSPHLCLFSKTAILLCSRSSEAAAEKQGRGDGRPSGSSGRHCGGRWQRRRGSRHGPARRPRLQEARAHRWCCGSRGGRGQGGREERALAGGAVCPGRREAGLQGAGGLRRL